MHCRASFPVFVALVAALAGMVIVGCTTEDADESARHAVLMATGGADSDADGLFHIEVTLYRRYTGSTWKPDKDHEFRVKDESHVRARVALQNLRDNRTYSVHLAWIRPDGKEMFRRYAEVTRSLVSLPIGIMPDSTGTLPSSVVRDLTTRWGDEDGERIAARLAKDPTTSVPVTERIYKKAVDLGYAKRSVSLSSKPTATLLTNLNISREKERQPGDYVLRIYLDRRLLQEVPFVVEDPEWTPPAGE